MSKSQNAWGVILACGKTEQVSNDVDTAFLQLGNQPILAYSLNAFEQCPGIEHVMVVARKERLESIVGMARMFGFPKLNKLSPGAIQKSTSLRAALSAVDADVSMIVIHEASRPCITQEMLDEVIKAAKRHGKAVIATRKSDPVSVVAKGVKSDKILDGQTVWSLHMPVAIKRDLLESILNPPISKKGGGLDDAALSEALFADAYLVETNLLHPRIGVSGDMPLVSALLKI